MAADNATSAMSTRHKLLSLIDDVEIATKELLEVMSTPKGQRPDQPDTTVMQLMQLLVHKDKEIKDTLKLAEEQADIQKTVDELKIEVEKRDHDIKNLQKSLKEAETILATAVYQAKQKLAAINQANKRTISSEDLIKFAHRISASNAVAAPSTWTPGDPRRPYPTDFDMRSGLLGKISDLPIGSLQSQLSYSEVLGSTRPPQMEVPTQSSSSVTWQPPPEVSHAMSTSSANAHQSPYHAQESSFKGHNKENEDVEYMSSESSSSSSSDE